MDPTPSLRVHNYLTRRFRRSYLHDMRGGLQGIQNSMELLARAVRGAGESGPLVDRAIDLAKRAIAGHEQTLERTLDELVSAPEERKIVSVRGTLDGILRFVQNDMASKGLWPEFVVSEDFSVLAHPHRLRHVLLGAISVVSDSMGPGAPLQINERRLDGQGCIDVGTANLAEPSVERAQLVSDLSELVRSDGGQMRISEPGSRGSQIHVTYPVV